MCNGKIRYRVDQPLKNLPCLFPALLPCQRNSEQPGQIGFVWMGGQQHTKAGFCFTVCLSIQQLSHLRESAARAVAPLARQLRALLVIGTKVG